MKKFNTFFCFYFALLLLWCAYEYFFDSKSSHIILLCCAFIAIQGLLSGLTHVDALNWWFRKRRTAEQALSDYVNENPSSLIINVGYTLGTRKENGNFISANVKSKASDKLAYPNYRLIKKVLSAIDQSNIKPLNFVNNDIGTSVYIIGVHSLYMHLFFMSVEDKAAFEFFLNSMPD